MSFNWLDLVCLALVTVPTIALHETGHLLAAFAVGLPVSSINIGLGPVLWGRCFNGVWLRVCLFPVGGFVRPVWLSRRKWKNIAVWAAGPAANLLTAPALLFVPDMGSALAFWSVFAAVVNLMPIVEGSDGHQILQELKR
jgi:membrane-associated protease RseP (regulator of RpoE activity)